MQPLSEEEKSKRHILGRLYGPIATCEEATRNGRKYNRDLWEKALNDEVFKEKIANKSLFLELGHPADREETDMEKVCACIPEIPKIVDGDLYAVVDILDTTNGKLLKTLCDYGFTPGISSRGSGDVMANNEVDPDTFFLETWDIVQLPAVKKARLSMCESLDTQQAGLKRALLESYKAADNKEKIEMKEALDNLSIDLNTTDEDIPDADPSLYDDDDSAEPLVEKASKEEIDKTEENKSVDEAPVDETPVEIEETDTDDNADNDAVTGMLTADDAIAIAVKTVLDLLNDKSKDAESTPTDDEIASVAKTNVAEVLDRQATEIKAVSDDELPDADPSIEGDIDETSDEKPEEADKSSDKATDDGVKE